MTDRRLIRDRLESFGDITELYEVTTFTGYRNLKGVTVRILDQGPDCSPPENRFATFPKTMARRREATMRGPLMRPLGLSIGKTWTEEPANQPRTGRARVKFVEISNLVPTLVMDLVERFYLQYE